MQQIIVAPWSSGKGSSYSIFGLTTEGKMFRYDRPCDNWLPCGMEIAVCYPEHEKARIKRQKAKVEGEASIRRGFAKY